MTLNLQFCPPLRLWFGTIGLGALGVAAILSSGCNTEPSVITSKTSKFEVDNQPTRSAAPSATTAEGKAFATAAARQETASTAADETPPPKPSATPPASIQSQAAGEAAARPDKNDPQQQLAYLEQLLKRQPEGATREEAIARFERTQNEIIEVANAILGMDTDEATKLRASEGKVQALSMLIQIGRPQAKKDLQIFLAGLSKNENPALARLGRRMSFAQQMDSFASGEIADSTKLLKDFQALFADEERDSALFHLGTQVASLFIQLRKNPEALSVMKTTHESFRTHADAKLAAQARSLGEEIKMIELDFNTKLAAFMEGAPGSEESLFNAIDQLFTSQEPGPTTLDLLRQMAGILESRSMDAAARVYDKIKVGFEKHPDLGKDVTIFVENFNKRKALLGQPFIVDGVNLNGSSFDWSKYQGKVVLIDFWATWCKYCLDEMPNIRMNYEEYHDRGFEVVGINLDEDRQRLDQFFSLQKFPWATVLSSDPNRMGMDSPLAVKCGLEGIPFMVLIGRDGKAVALNTRGELLGKKLAELLGDAPAANPADPAAKTKGKTSQMSPRRRQTSVASVVSYAALDQDRSFAGRRPSDAAHLELASVAPSTLRRDTDERASDSLDLAYAVALRSNEQAESAPARSEDDTSNPYLARPGLGIRELIDFIQEMRDKPQSIQKRPGFSAAIADAADRVLAGAADDKQQRIAIAAKFEALHRAAVAGDAEADKQLGQFVDRCKDDQRPEVVREVRFFQAEQTAISAKELSVDKISPALDELRTYLERETLSAKHLRMASSIVEAINRLEEGDAREARFQEFGKLFAKSDSKELARYGNRVAGTK